MNKETIEYIRRLFSKEIETTKSYMMSAINGGFDDLRVKERIKEYRQAYNAWADFCDWEDTLESDNG